MKSENAPTPVPGQKKAEMRDRIAHAAFDLFQEEGYEKTTMRQIAKESGILTGSLYNAFRNKEEIFNHIFLKAIDLEIEGSIQAVENEKDILYCLSVPFTVELIYSDKNERLCELLHMAYSSWNTSSDIVEQKMEWFGYVLKKFGIDYDTEIIRNNILALIGIQTKFIDKRHYEGKENIRNDTELTVMFIAGILKIPAFSVIDTVDRLCALSDHELFSKTVELW